MKRLIGGRYAVAAMLLIVLALFSAGCGGGQGGYKDNVLIGHFSRVDHEQGKVIVDISEWAHRNDKGPVRNDWGMVYHGKQTSSTVVRNESGEKVELATLKSGQKVRIYPPDPSNEKIDEVVVMEMTNQEKYKRMGLIAQGNNQLYTVLVNGQAAGDRYDDSNMEQELHTALQGGLSLMEYDPKANELVDIKDEFELKSFPAFLVFDNEKLVYKTYKTDELEKFLQSQ
ncbi:hypothetical protein [Paenibacillus sp. YIM B09110]|uniref:hypothetical protein n=1 Tax=Paenibacillus sp. YIM B09110 TaxID=3126102 RepID=UPI00301B806D